MKKMLMILVGALTLAGAVFGLENYTVQSVTGRVEREMKNGTWEAVRAGDVLAGETVLRTGIGASVTVIAGDNTYVIGAAKKDVLSALAAGGAKESGVRIGGQISRTDTGAAERSTGRIGTASARAGNAADELPIDEE